MESALIVTASEKSIAYMTEILNEASVYQIVTVSNAGDARRLLIDSNYDLYIINTPLPDEFGEALARTIASKCIAGVLLLVRAELYDEVAQKVEDFGIIAVSRPINRAIFWNAIKMSGAMHKKMQKMQAENQTLMQKLEDIRVIDRAKCLLISYLAMTEPEAHKYIERQAMDMRVTRREIADEILKTYEY